MDDKGRGWISSSQGAQLPRCMTYHSQLCDRLQQVARPFMISKLAPELESCPLINVLVMCELRKVQAGEEEKMEVGARTCR